MNPIIKFLVAPAGRLARIVAGLALIGTGLFWFGGTGGIIIAVVGLAPLLAGAFDLCLFAPLFGHSLSGARTRAGR